jgi:hypothetical protein
MSEPAQVHPDNDALAPAFFLAERLGRHGARGTRRKQALAGKTTAAEVTLPVSVTGRGSGWSNA